MDPDAARELKARILKSLPSAIDASQTRAYGTPWPWVAVGLSPTDDGAAVAVRLQREADRALLPDLGRAAAAELDVRVIGPVHSLSSPAQLQQRVRPLRPGLSVAHPTVSAGTIGGFVRVGADLAILSNNHVLAAGNAGAVGDAVLQPGPADGGGPGDRVATLAAFVRLVTGTANLVDAAVAALDAGIDAAPADLPGGPLLRSVPPSLDIDMDEAVEKLGRTTGHTFGRITAVEVDAVGVQYDAAAHRFDDQIEIEGRAGAFSGGGDSGSVIWRSRDRAPIGLLFAGSEAGGVTGTGLTYATPLATVLEALGVEWVAG